MHADCSRRTAERKGLYVGLLPMWGKYCPADTGNCERFGRFIGERFRDHANIIWILGGDRPAPTKPEQDAWRAMAKGIAISVSGREDYDRVLMTYHTFGPDASSKYFNEDSWLDFNGIQSSHGDRILNWKMIERDYQRQPTKPVIDLETSYPGIGLNKMAPGNEDHARRSAYWAVFSGAFGHTYRHNSIWQMYTPSRKSMFGVTTSWQDAPSAVQMGFLLCNNRWGGGNGRIWFKDHGDRWSFWTEHSDDLKLTVAETGAEPVRLPLEMSHVHPT